MRRLQSHALAMAALFLLDHGPAAAQDRAGSQTYKMPRTARRPSGSSRHVRSRYYHALGAAVRRSRWYSKEEASKLEMAARKAKGAGRPAHRGTSHAPPERRRWIRGRGG